METILQSRAVTQRYTCNEKIGRYHSHRSQSDGHMTKFIWGKKGSYKGSKECGMCES